MRNSSSLDWLRFMHTPNDYRVSQKVFQRNGKPAHLIQIAQAFEKVFNCSFGSIYDQQEKVFDRKPFNRTKALDFLRNLIIRKDKEGRNKQDEK